MPTFRCPVCRKPLSKHEYESALGILDERDRHAQHKNAELLARVRRLESEKAKARSEGIRAERSRTQRILAGRDRQIRSLHEQLRRLKKGTTPQTDGLEFEDRLFVRLRREFKTDDIQHDGKGGDILHVVQVNGKPAGLILYECKRCRRIATDHMEQAARDKRTRQADFAVVVTTGTRRGFTGLAHEGSVLLVSPLGVIALARLVRAQLIEMARARLTKSQREQVAVAVLQYVTSPVFRAPLEDAIAKTHRARLLLQKEMNAHVLLWQNRWALYQTVDLDLHSITENTERVLHGGKPAPVGRFRPTPLRLPAATVEGEVREQR